MFNPPHGTTTKTMRIKSKSGHDLTLQMARISDTHFEYAMKIYERYLHNLAVYFSGIDAPNAAMTQEQFRIAVSASVYAKQV